MLPSFQRTVCTVAGVATRLLQNLDSKPNVGVGIIGSKIYIEILACRLSSGSLNFTVKDPKFKNIKQVMKQKYYRPGSRSSSPLCETEAHTCCTWLILWIL